MERRVHGRRDFRCDNQRGRGKRRRKGGAQGRNRTADTRIFSPLLYQLSYLGDRQVSEAARKIPQAATLASAGGKRFSAWIIPAPGGATRCDRSAKTWTQVDEQQELATGALSRISSLTWHHTGVHSSRRQLVAALPPNPRRRGTGEPFSDGLPPSGVNPARSW